MKTSSLRAVQILLVTAAVGALGLAAAGCTSSATPSSAPAQSAPATSASAGPSTVTSSPATPSTPSAVQAVTAEKLKFPNTTATVEFLGYDETNKMPKFQKVTQDPTAPYADLIPDPQDPAVHELPLAPGTDVTPIDPSGFPFETCPPLNCTSDDIVRNVMSHTTLWAKIHVNAADRIDSVREIAY
ncbi:MAG TPA: hypothetical protein VJ914_40415 [Pseudonocardiaceae bacterium]|nr:hypothetical protein [Pseudonocardiaceae bacterium]